MKEFDKIYTDYFQRVYKFVYSLCLDRALAEEVTQETFFKALKGIDKFHGTCKIDTWLCTIAHNTLYTYIKKHRNHDGYPSDIMTDSDDIEQKLAARETAYEIHKILHKLSEPYKEVFWLRVYGDLSFAQIGDLFGKSENWARVTYYTVIISVSTALLLFAGFYLLFDAPIHELDKDDVSVKAETFLMSEIAAEVVDGKAMISAGGTDEGRIYTLQIPSMPQLKMTVTEEAMKRKEYVSIVQWTSPYYIKRMKAIEGEDQNTLYIKEFKTTVFDNKIIEGTSNTTIEVIFRKIDRVVLAEADTETPLWETGI